MQQEVKGYVQEAIGYAAEGEGGGEETSCGS